MNTITKHIEKSENIDELVNQIQVLSQKLEEIKILAGKEQQRWVSMDEGNSPIWTLPFKKIVKIIEN